MLMLALITITDAKAGFFFKRRQPVFFQPQFVQQQNQFGIVLDAIEVREEGQWKLVRCKGDDDDFCQQLISDEKVEERLLMDREGLVLVSRNGKNVKVSEDVRFALGPEYGCPKPKSKDPRVGEFCEHNEQLFKNGPKNGGNGLIGSNRTGVVGPGNNFTVNPTNPLQLAGGQPPQQGPGHNFGPLQPAQPPQIVQRPVDSTPPLAGTPHAKWNAEFEDTGFATSPTVEKLREVIGTTPGKVDPTVAVLDTECTSNRQPQAKSPFKLFLADKNGGVSIAIRKSDTIATLDQNLMTLASQVAVSLTPGGAALYGSVGGNDFEFGGTMPAKEYYLKRLVNQIDGRGLPAYSLRFVVKHAPSQARMIGPNDDVYSCRSTGTPPAGQTPRFDQMAQVGQQTRLNNGVMPFTEILNAE